MNNLKDELIKLGSQNPDLRSHLKPVLDHLTKSGADFSDIKDKGRLFEKWEYLKDRLGAKKALRAVLGWMGDQGAREAFEYIKRQHDIRGVEIDNRSKWGDLMEQFLRFMRPDDLADELVMGMGVSDMRRMLEDRYQIHNLQG